MTDHPILFSAPMVRALLAGAKTQTRRLIKWQGPKGFPHSFEHAKVDNPAGVQRLLVPYNHPDEADEPWGENGYHRHYGRADPGDRLWVREAWCDANSDYGPVVCYRADNHRWYPPYTGPDEGAGPSFDYERYPGNWTIWAADLESSDKGWRPSIHMPRIFSRLTLHVTQVRVQRLQEISEADAFAEGISTDGPVAGIEVDIDGFWWAGAGKERYRKLWNSINGEGSWDANPWVIATSFTVEKINIDAAVGTGSPERLGAVTEGDGGQSAGANTHA